MNSAAPVILLMAEAGSADMMIEWQDPTDPVTLLINFTFKCS